MFWWTTVTLHPLETLMMTCAMTSSLGKTDLETIQFNSDFSLAFLSNDTIIFFFLIQLWKRPPDHCLWKWEEPNGALCLWSISFHKAQESEDVHRLSALCYQAVSGRRLSDAHAGETNTGHSFTDTRLTIWVEYNSNMLWEYLLNSSIASWGKQLNNIYIYIEISCLVSCYHDMSITQVLLLNVMLNHVTKYFSSLS